MGEPSNANIRNQVDDFYNSALFKTHDLIPISDENYFSATTVSPQPEKIARKGRASSSSSSYQAQVFCKICMETVPADEVFQTSNDCPHVFCRDCLSHYLGTKIRENISVLKCPEKYCNAVLEPGMCQELLPSEVFKRWESALCESIVLGAQKFYCPFKDCLALMVDDGDETVTPSECPSCRRLFCATCKVAWHSGLSCEDFGKLGEDERGNKNLLMMQVAKEKKERRCPSCKYFGEKRDSSLHITCRCCLCSSVSTDTESLSSRSFSHAPSEVAAADKALKQEIKFVEVTSVRTVSREKSKEELRNEVLSKADAAGSSELYSAFKGPEEITEAISKITDILKSDGGIPTIEEAEREVITKEEKLIESPGVFSHPLQPGHGSNYGVLKYPQDDMGAQCELTSVIGIYGKIISRVT